MKVLFLIFFLTSSSIGYSAESNSVPTHYFRLLHTDLSLRPHWERHELEGTAQIQILPHFYPQNKIDLDAKCFDIHEVSLIQGSHRKALDYNYNRQKLIVFLDKTYTRNDTISLYIRYTAHPDSVVTWSGRAKTDEKGLYFINTDGKRKNIPTQLWTQGETQANSAWFPTIDIPSQKHTQRISVTYDQKWVSLSNGTLVSSTRSPDGMKTDIWEQTQPHSVYLTLLVIGDFKIVRDYWRGREISYYMEPQYESMARPIFGRTMAMLDFFSDKLGVEFSWDKYAQVIVHDFVAGAMENTSAVTFNTAHQKDTRELLDDNDDETIAHELMHHWFGDLVTCRDWSQLTLNESFANYAEYLWHEHKDGRDEAQAFWQRDINPYFSSSSRLRRPLVSYDYEKADDMFDLISYQKGGKILHLLRTYIGDEAFFAALKLYLTRHRYETTEYTDLKKCFEDITGEDLKWFFDQWYLRGGHPILTSSHRIHGDTVHIFLSQKHNFDSSYLYRIPLELHIFSDSQIVRKNILLSQKSDSFRYVIPHVRALSIDGKQSLVGIKNETNTTDEWIYLLRHSPNYLDRANALKKLYSKRNLPEVKAVLFQMLDSENPRLVSQAIRTVYEKWLPIEPKWDSALIAIAKYNPKGDTRAAALAKIGEQDSLERFRDLILLKLSDSSYRVEAEALRLYAKIDSAEALSYAQKSIQKNHFGILSTAFELIANTKDSNMMPYFDEGIAHARGYNALAIYARMGTYLASQDNRLYLPKIEEFKNMIQSKQGADKYAGSYALNALKTELNRIDDAQSQLRIKHVDEILKLESKDHEQ